MMGPSGSGKKTTAHALALELNRSIKTLHMAGKVLVFVSVRGAII